MGRDTRVPNGSVGTRRHAACRAGAEKRRREREATGASNASPVARHEQDERRGCNIPSKPSLPTRSYLPTTFQ